MLISTVLSSPLFQPAAAAASPAHRYSELGWFSPTEAAAVGAFLFALLRRALTLRILVDCMSEAAAISGMIFLILVGAAVFNYFVETSGLPQLLVQLVGDLCVSSRTCRCTPSSAASCPFLADIARLAILLAIPGISLWLPARMQ